MLAKRERDLTRMVKCCEAAFADHAKGTLLESPDIGDGGESKAKVYEFGKPELMPKPKTQPDPKAKKPFNPRVCVDSFLFRAIEHWIREEELEEERTGQTYHSWDASGDGKLDLEEFALMIRFANPTAGRQRIIRAFIAACGTSEGDEDCVLVERLVPALQYYGLVLKPRPKDWEHGAPPPAYAPAPSATLVDDDALFSAEDHLARGADPVDVLADHGPSLANRRRSLSSVLSSSMQQLGTMTSVLRAMGDYETATEQDVAVELTQPGMV